MAKGRGARQAVNWRNIPITLKIPRIGVRYVEPSSPFRNVEFKLIRLDTGYTGVHGGPPRLNQNFLQLGAQHRDHVIGGDHAGQLTVFVYDRQGQQVVLVEQFSEFLFFRVFVAGNEGLLGQRQERG